MKFKESFIPILQDLGIFPVCTHFSLDVFSDTMTQNGQCSSGNYGIRVFNLHNLIPKSSSPEVLKWHLRAPQAVYSSSQHVRIEPIWETIGTKRLLELISMISNVSHVALTVN